MAGTKPRGDLDRSAAHATLMDLDPRFGQLDLNGGSRAITEFLDAWYEDTTTLDMYAYARDTHLPLSAPIQARVVKDMYRAVLDSRTGEGEPPLKLMVHSAGGGDGEVRALRGNSYEVLTAWGDKVNVASWAVTKAVIEIR